jgi:hypothetical protein
MGPEEVNKKEEAAKAASFDPGKQKHYKQRPGIEAIEYATSNNMNFCEGSVIKYLHRYPFKGTPVEDLKKARWYLDKLIEQQNVKVGQ